MTPIETKLMLAKVINISDVRSKRLVESCAHRAILVDVQLSTVECGDCGEKLNPVMMLSRMGREESRWAEEYKRLQGIKKTLETRTRCKCQHCGQMTRIKV